MAVAGPVAAMRDDHVMDTRTPSPSHTPTNHADNSADGTGSEKDYKPDLSAEVAMLSTKLVNAINYQTNLDDSLQHTRLELEQVRQDHAQLRAQKEELDEMVSICALVQKSDMDEAVAKLRAELSSEKTAREAAEKAKKQTEGELENLTSALFEEANTMVAAARRDTEAVEKRNSQLRSKLNDTELLLASQQEQLKDLKTTMERIRDASPSARGDGSVPSTPIMPNSGAFEAMMNSSDGHPAGELSPEPSLRYPYLVTPVLREDIPAYNEFQELLLLARRLGAHSRQSSNSGNPTSSSQSNIPATTSTPNLPGTFSFSSTSSSPSSSAPLPTNNLPPLKESKFYKRILTEDLDPTFRLDLAPGLSFLSRRAAFSSLLNGSLSIEPFPQSATNKHYHACCLCGESRRSEAHVRRWRFRTSEEDGVMKPLCMYCVGRVRASCDFIAFLRAVREGLWGEKQGAWEESVKLREAMWWSRIGGGVVPHGALPRHEVADKDEANSAAGMKSGRHSLDSSAGKKDDSPVAGVVNEEPAPSVTQPGLQAEADKPLPQPPATPERASRQNFASLQPPPTHEAPSSAAGDDDDGTSAHLSSEANGGLSHHSTTLPSVESSNDDALDTDSNEPRSTESSPSAQFVEATDLPPEEDQIVTTALPPAVVEPTEQELPSLTVAKRASKKSFDDEAQAPTSPPDAAADAAAAASGDQVISPAPSTEMFDFPATTNKLERSYSATSSTSSQSLPPPPPPHAEERPVQARSKPSGGVLARVRAMEARAAAQGK